MYIKLQTTYYSKFVINIIFINVIKTVTAHISMINKFNHVNSNNYLYLTSIYYLLWYFS